MPLDWDKLRIFHAAAEAGSFTHAAEKLHLSQSAISRQVSALKRDGVIVLEGKRHVTIPDFNRLMEEAGDDSDGGMLG